MKVTVEAVKMRDPMIASGAATEQAAVETLLSLAFPSPVEGTWSPAEKTVVLAIVSVAELLVKGDQD